MRLNLEIDFLKKQDIRTIVSLTENHNQKEELGNHFNLHHLAIEDLKPPQFEQVLHVAEIIRKARAERKRVVVHCMAGIGRTSTMLMAAHLSVRGFELNTILTKRIVPSGSNILATKIHKCD